MIVGHLTILSPFEDVFRERAASCFDCGSKLQSRQVYWRNSEILFGAMLPTARDLGPRWRFF